MVFGGFAKNGFPRLRRVRPETAMPLSISNRSEKASNDHACRHGLVCAGIDEDERTGEAVAAVGVVE